MVALIATGCTSVTSRAEHINVDHRVALFDSPVAISVSGLEPGEQVTLTASASDCGGNTWVSNATFTAHSTGNVDLGHDAPTSGSYQWKQAMGLLWSLTPRAAFTEDETLCAPTDSLTVKVVAEVQGKVGASITLTRLAAAAGVREQELRPTTSGFYGDFFAPPSGSPTRPGVLLFGGSEGGLSTTTEAGLFASHGYPTLAVAYFGEPGLPQTLQNIPLEYFVTALRWLAKQPGVNPDLSLGHASRRG